MTPLSKEEATSAASAKRVFFSDIGAAIRRPRDGHVHASPARLRWRRSPRARGDGDRGLSPLRWRRRCPQDTGRRFSAEGALSR
jgi:hypothetical protein